MDDEAAFRRSRRRVWRLFVLATLLLPVVAGGYTIATWQPIYRAEHLLEESVDYLLFPHVQPATPMDLAVREAGLINSPIVLDPVLADAALRGAPSLSNPATASTNLRKNLSVERLNSPHRMVVAYRDTDPQAAANVCNAVVESYLRQTSSIAQSKVAQLERWLAPEVQRWETEVESKQRHVVKLSEQVGIAGAEHKRSRLHQYENMLAELEVEIAVLRAREPPPESEIAELQLRLELARRQYEELRSELSAYDKPSAELEFAQQELEVAQSVLKKLRDRVAAIRTERRHSGNIRSLAHATPPDSPVNVPLIHALLLRSGIAFFVPLLVMLFIRLVRFALS